MRRHSHQQCAFRTDNDICEHFVVFVSLEEGAVEDEGGLDASTGIGLAVEVLDADVLLDTELYHVKHVLVKETA